MITGYTDRLSVPPGDVIRCYVSVDEASTISVATVQLLGGEQWEQLGTPSQIPWRTEADGAYQAAFQGIQPGSYAATEQFGWVFASNFEIECSIRATIVASVPEIVWSLESETGACLTRLSVAQSYIALTLRDRQVVTLQLPEGFGPTHWLHVQVRFEHKSVSITARDWTSGVEASVAIALPPAVLPVVEPQSLVRLLWGRSSEGRDQSFDGRMARPALSSARASGAVWRWPLGANLGEAVIEPSERGAPALRLINSPLRAVAGPEWDSTVDHPSLAPAQYDAMHLHSDDVTDAGWTETFKLQIAADMPSGAYAFRLATEGQPDDYIPFFVTDSANRSQSDVLVVFPTWTYLAYANWRTYAEDATARAEYFGELRPPNEADIELQRHPEFGLCFYDEHADGSGVCHTSARRPILNFRPTYIAGHAKGYRHLSSDLQLLAWLKDRGISYAVSTDDEIHDRGGDALKHFKVVLTGSHPEYCSASMLDAFQAYASSDGCLMYLGGNGFYWVTSPRVGERHVLEMRRGHNGIRRWDSPPGEEHLSTGELGGLWRYRGRRPQQLFGVGLSAQGFDHGSGYQRTDISYSPGLEWIFRGIETDIFGAGEGPLGGAAGDEIDCCDVGLGTPPGTIRLASSICHSDRYLLAIENIPHLKPSERYGGQGNDGVRSDVVLVPHNGRFSVFSVGSIAWINAICSVPKGSASRLTENVLRGFLSGVTSL